MAATFKIGQEVKLIAEVPQGAVKELSVNQDGDIQYLVAWTDVQGEDQSRWFSEDTLALV
jgi:uncharacterized protein YodC (DUF2158 family)